MCIRPRHLSSKLHKTTVARCCDNNVNYLLFSLILILVKSFYQSHQGEKISLWWKPSYSGGNLLTLVETFLLWWNILTVTHIFSRHHTDIMVLTFMTIFTFVWDMVLYCDHVIIETVSHTIPLLNPANIPSSRSILTRHNICVTDILTLDCSMHAHIWHYNVYQRNTDPIIQWNTRNAQIMSKEHCTLHPFVTVFMNCT